MKKKLQVKINGGKIPEGRIRVSGAKNAATRILAASMISDSKITLKNFPTELVDAKYKIDFIKKNGGEIQIDPEKEIITVSNENLSNTVLEDYDFPIRTTYLLVAGLIKKSGKANIPYPGGCKIGNRGYDLHIMIWEKLGAKVSEKDKYITVEAPKGFTPNEITFPISTIGGTENALICASTIKGETIIKNAYISPEVQNLIEFLRTIGVKIDVVGNSYISVRGASYLGSSIFQIIPDRIEALTWIVYGILSKGKLTIEDVPFDTMEIPLIHLKHMGIEIYRNSKNAIISPECLVNGDIQPFELACGTHPGVISDMQPFFTLLALHANGVSRIYDYRYPKRIKYCDELNTFYSNAISAQEGKITVTGKNPVSPGKAKSTDLRGSMAIVIAALLASGKSTINNVEMALRGYNNLKLKLKGLGIDIGFNKI